jgi:hypothetical protein
MATEGAPDKAAAVPDKIGLGTGSDNAVIPPRGSVGSDANATKSGSATSTDHEQPSAAEPFVMPRRNFWLVFSTLMICCFLAGLDGTIVVTGEA